MSRSIVTSLLFLAGAIACKGERPAPSPATAAPAPAPAAPAPRLRILATIGDSASTIEGLGEFGGKLYTVDWKDGGVYRVDPASGAAERVGQLPTKPKASILGVAMDKAGNLYAAAPESGIIYRIDAARLGAADFKPAKDAKVFATGAIGANGIAFDANGHLWMSGSATNSVYHVGPAGGKAMVFVKGYAKESSDTTIPVRQYVSNGMAFDAAGNAYTGNTGSGEISKIEVKPGYVAGAVTSFANDPRLIGADGLLFDAAGNLWVTANFRSSIGSIAPDGSVTIVVDDSTGSVLHMPAEFKRIGNTIYVSNLNFPIGANAHGTFKGAQIAAVDLP